MTAPFGADGCTCRPFTARTNPPRHLQPGDKVDKTTSWQRDDGCVHHGTEAAAPTAPAVAAHPLVNGRCPACGGSSLFLGSGGYLSCARLDCPQPDAATEVISDFWDARQHGAFTFCSQSVGHVTMTEFAKKISEKRTALAQRDEAAEYANEQKRQADNAQAAIGRLLAFCGEIDNDTDWRPAGPEVACRIRSLITGETDQPADRHGAGPSVREAAADDRRWPLEKAGE